VGRVVLVGSQAFVPGCSSRLILRAGRASNGYGQRLRSKGDRVLWSEIEGWFQWRSGQEEAVSYFPPGSTFVEVGVYLGRSICSLAEVVALSGKPIKIIGVDTCLGSGPEGPSQKNYHGVAVEAGGGTFAGALHRNVLACGYGDAVMLLITDSMAASQLWGDQTLDWVHLDARHDFHNLTADITAWLPKVRPGGWLTGDDYDLEKWPEVISAVNALLPDAEPWSSQQWRWRIPAAIESSAHRPRGWWRHQ